MNFSEALKAMKMGNKVSREVWRGKIAHWTLLITNKLMLIETAPDGTFNKSVEIKSEDILADDWFLVT